MSLLLLLLTQVVRVHSLCDALPFALPIKDIQVSKTVPNSLMRGIPAKLGSPEQDVVLMPWADLNNTWIYNQQTFCDSTVIFTNGICLVRRGQPFDETSSQSFVPQLDIINAGGATQETNVIGSELGVPKLIGTSAAGTEALTLGSSTVLSQFPIGIPRLGWDRGYTTLHALGVGSNSTFLNHLKIAGQIGARIWSIYWGRMWTTNNPLDGALVLGGYDRSKVVGRNYTQALDFTSTGCWTGMKVNIAQIIINARNGTDSNLLFANTVIPVCIVPQRQLLLEAPATVMDAFDLQTGSSTIGLSFGLHWSAQLYKTGTAFDGDITIVLDSGLSVRVPNDQYVVPFVSWDSSGGRIFNQSQTEVLISRVEAQPATLGRYFLTAAYLMVDQETETFTLWQANPTANSNLVRSPLQQDSGICSNATNATSPTDGSSTGSSSSGDKFLSAGATAGIVIALIAVLSVVGLVFFALHRQRRLQAGSHNEHLAVDPPVQFQKFELHNESTSHQGLLHHDTKCSSRTSGIAELYQPPAETYQPHNQVYEMYAGTPPLPPPKR